jgi:hypothetical protein
MDVGAALPLIVLFKLNYEACLDGLGACPCLKLRLITPVAGIDIRQRR